jgi:CheY-like chemotaxis protein
MRSRAPRRCAALPQQIFDVFSVLEEELPLCYGQREQQPITSMNTDLSAMPGRPPDPKPGRVLIIDDEQPVRELFQRTLQFAGFDVAVASSGDEGLNRLRSDASICLILLDLNMAEMDGHQVRNAQRADPHLADIPMIVVSGAPLSGIVHDELLAADYLLKPVGHDHLISVVGRYCRRRV